MDPGIKIWPLPQRICSNRDSLMNTQPPTHTHTHTRIHTTTKVQRKSDVWIKAHQRVTRESLLFLTEKERMKDRWKCGNDGKRREKRNTHAAHKHSGVAVSGMQSVEGLPPYLKISSLGWKISPGPLFIDEESHTHTHTVTPFSKINRQYINIQVQEITNIIPSCEKCF